MKKPLLLGIILTVCVVIVTFVFAQAYPLGIVSLWKFDEGSGNIAIDSVNGNQGTIIGGARTSGQVGGALSFDGVNNYVRVLDNFNLDFGPSQDFSLEAWIKAKADQTSFQGTILAKLNPPGQPAYKRSYGYSLMVRGVADLINEGKMGVWLGDGNASDGLFALYSVETYDDDTWHHVVATIDRDSLAILYIDGSAVNNADVSHLSSLDESNFENLEIGREGVYDTYWFNGLIDEVAIYDRTLTPEEIQHHYQDGLHGLGYDVECVLPPSGLVSWWPGDENADDIWDTNNGILKNDVTYATGRVDKAFSFDGVDAYVLIGKPVNLDITGEITIDAWIKPQNLLDGQVATIAGKWGWRIELDSYILSLFKQNGVIKLASGIGDGLTADQGLIGGQIPYNKWSHVATTYNSFTGHHKIYLNGSVVNSRFRSGIHSTNLNVLIGAQEKYGTTLWRFFPGLIDEIEIFNRALEASEILDIYLAGSAGKFKAKKVTIDIKPGTDPNEINLGSKGVIPVAILSSACFNATTVDPDTVGLAGAEVAVRGKSNRSMAHEKDVNGDGLIDLVVQVETENLDPDSFQAGLAILTGETYGGVAIEGSDYIIIVKE